MRKNLEIIVRVLAYATFFVPLIVLPSSFIFPFIVPKVILFRSLAVSMVAGFALLYLVNPVEYQPRKTWLSVALLAFIASFALSTFLGVDYYHSLWDNHERMLGLFTMLHYGVYYLVCTSIFSGWKEWKWALRIFLVAGSICMFIAFLQVGNPQLLLNQGSDRVASTLGNAIYVGGYGLFLFFIALLLFLKEKNVVWKFVTAGLGILALVGLGFSGTRGSTLGLLVGIFTILAGYAWLSKEHPALRKWVSIALVAAVLGLAGLYMNRQSVWVQDIPGLGRLLNTPLLAGTGSTRIIAWKIAIQSWKENPLFGWGPNNFFFAFNKYYNPVSLNFGYGETWFDNAHNILLNTLTVQGLVGLITYLGIFIVAWLVISRAYRAKIIDKPIAIITSAFLLAHLLQNVTVFENPTSYLYFMFMLALINNLCNPKPSEATASTDRSPSQGVIGAVVLSALVFIFITDIQPARANMKSLATMIAFNSDPAGQIQLLRDTVAFSSPHVDDIRSDLARVAVQAVSSYSQQIGQDKSLEILNLIDREIEKNIALHPADIRNYLLSAQINQLGFALTNQVQYILSAERHLQTSLEYSPHRQQLIYMLATMKAQLNKKDEAYALMRQTITDNPKVSESYWRLSYIAFYYGDTSLAKEVFAEAAKNNVIFDAQGEQVRSMVFGPAVTSTKK